MVDGGWATVDKGNSSGGQKSGGGRWYEAPVSIYVNYRGERKSRSPRCRPAKQVSYPRLARDDVGRGIKAVINYAITRFYLKIKTVFFASMRLTDSHIALTSPSFSHLLFFSPGRFFCLSRSIFHSRRFSSGKSFWVLLAAKDARLHLFADSSYFSLLQPRPPSTLPRYLMGRVFLPVFLLHPFSQASLIQSSFSSAESCAVLTPESTLRPPQITVEPLRFALPFFLFLFLFFSYSLFALLL